VSLYAGENTRFGTLVEDDQSSRKRVFMAARTGNGAVAQKLARTVARHWGRGDTDV